MAENNHSTGITPSEEPLLRRLVRRIMATSEFEPEMLYQQLALPALRELVYRICSLVIFVITIPTAALCWYLDRSGLALLEGLISATLALHCYLLMAKNIRVYSPLALMLVAFILFIMCIAAGFTPIIYMGFAFPVSFYLYMEREVSIYLNICWWVICSIVAAIVLAPIDALVFSIALASVGFFSELLNLMLSRHESSLKQQAVRDPLTGAYNRRAMTEALRQTLTLRNRYDAPASIVMIDIDRFKVINDNFGHKEGDLVLKNLVNDISDCLRSSDTLFRFGGEEFVALLPGVGRMEAAKMAERFCEEMRSRRLTENVKATISCGVAEVRNDDTVEAWLHRGDLALYAAKSAGRDCVRIEKPQVIDSDKVTPINKAWRDT